MATAGIINRRPGGRSSVKRATRNRPAMATPIKLVSWAISTTVITLTFDQPVSLNGVPQYHTELPPTPLSATRPTPTTVAITFSATQASATELYVPVEDPAIRNNSGGYVLSNGGAI